MIVVTGGAGFIGSALIWALNRRGLDDILVVDEFGTDDKWKNLVGVRFSDYVHKQDFLDQIEHEKYRGVKAVFHLGACSSTTERDCDYLARNNFEYSKRVCLWAKLIGARFIYASSAATYGDGSKGYDDDEAALEKLSPMNMYGYSKQMFDLWVKRNSLLGDVAGLKYFNVFGPNEYHKDDMASLIFKAFHQVKETGKIRLFKSYLDEYDHGCQKRDFIYVKDAVEMTLFFYDHPEVNGIFNTGTGSARTWNDLANAVFSAMDKKPEIEYIEMPESIRDRYQYFTEANLEKLRKAGYGIQLTSLEEGVADYIRGYLDTQNPYLVAEE